MNRKEFNVTTVTITNKEETYRVETMYENNVISSIRLFSNNPDYYYSIRLNAYNAEELRDMIDILILAYMDIRQTNSKVFPDLDKKDAR